MSKTDKIEITLCVIALIIILPMLKYTSIKYEKECNLKQGTIKLAYGKVKSCIDKNGNKIEMTK